MSQLSPRSEPLLNCKKFSEKIYIKDFMVPWGGVIYVVRSGGEM
jgi:hypothetical protein